MSHETEIQELVPKGIYPVGKTGGLREMMSLIGKQLDEIESAVKVFNAPENQIGDGLDLIGRLYGVYRSGRTDANYIDALVLKASAQQKISIPEIYELLPENVSYAKVENYSKGSTPRFFLDGKHFLKGKDTLTSIIKYCCAGLIFRGDKTLKSQDIIERIQKSGMMGLLFYFKPEYILSVSDFDESGIAYDGNPVPDEVSVYSDGILQNTFPVSVSDGKCDFELYETRCLKVDEIRLRKSGIEVANLVLDKLKFDFNIDAVVSIGGF